ncbi:hypothetical protein LCGC14_2322670, partial [marine sediment metagenome]
MHSYRIWISILVGFGVFLSTVSSEADDSAAPMKAGIIGLDAHALDWTRIVNDPKATGLLAEMTVVAGYPGGSPDIPQSMELLNRHVGPLREMGVQIVDSIDELIEKVDVVLLLSIDGRAHFEQVKPVFAAGKPVFIDKPIADSLAAAMKIFRLAEEQNVPCFTSSSLRFSKHTIDIRKNPKVGKVLGCDQYSPC